MDKQLMAKMMGWWEVPDEDASPTEFCARFGTGIMLLQWYFKDRYPPRKLTVRCGKSIICRSFSERETLALPDLFVNHFIILQVNQPDIWIMFHVFCMFTPGYQDKVHPVTGSTTDPLTSAGSSQDPGYRRVWTTAVPAICALAGCNVVMMVTTNITMSNVR